MLKDLKKHYRESDKLMLLPILVSIVFIIIGTLIFIINENRLPNTLPIFYSLPWGEGQLATRYEFLIILPLSLLITLINIVIGWQLHDSQLILKRALSLASLLVSLLIFITMVRAILIFI